MIEVLKEFLKTEEASNYIALLNISITTIVGIVLSCIIHKRYSRKKSTKDYIISEILSVRDLYIKQFDFLYTNSKSAKEIKDWFKIMSNRITCVDESVKKTYKTRGLPLKSMHNKIQIEVTNLEDYNNQYSKSKVLFSEYSKSEMLKYHMELLNKINNLVLDLYKK